MHLRKLVDRVFPPFADAKRSKPRDMLYVAQERPDTYTALVVGATHALSVLMLVIYTVIVARQLGMSEVRMQGFVTLEIVVMGAATLLQSLRTRFSSGHLVVHTPSTIGMAAFVAAATQFGLGAAAGGLILSALAIILLARLLPRLQTYFPPEVAGVLLVLLGLSLVDGGVRRFVGLADGRVDASALAISVTTLAVIIGVSVWSRRRLRVFAVVLGVVAGFSAAVATGDFGLPQLDRLGALPLLSLPAHGYALPTPTLVLAAAVPLVVIGLISALDSFGAGVAIDRMNNEKWRRADLPMIARLVSCNGLGLFLNGVTGTPPIGTSSANLGLVAVTGVGARRVGSVAGLLLIALAFLPQVSGFLISIPQPVVGAIIVYTAGYMFVVGMELILSRMLNNRRIFMVGLSLTVGASLLLMPELRALVPAELRPIFGSPLTMGALAAVGFNLLFRIGVSERGAIRIDGPRAAHEATEFLEERGAAWGARHDVITRAGAAVGEALEALHGAKLVDGPIRLEAGFDEYKLTLTLAYAGRALALQAKQKIDLSTWLDEDGDSGLDAAMAGMSSHLIRGLADKIATSEQGGGARLWMQFNH